MTDALLPWEAESCYRLWLAERGLESSWVTLDNFSERLNWRQPSRAEAMLDMTDLGIEAPVAYFHKWYGDGTRRWPIHMSLWPPESIATTYLHTTDFWGSYFGCEQKTYEPREVWHYYPNFKKGLHDD